MQKYNRLSHNDYFLLMARLAGLRGTCRRRTVGCILVDENHHVLSTGYNGVPSGEPHCIDVPCTGVDDPSGDTTRCRAVHAERNAVNQVLKRNQGLYVHRAYVTCVPCTECAKYLITHCTLLKEVHAIFDYPDGGGLILLERNHRSVQIHTYLNGISIDAIMAEGERWR